MKNVVNIFKFKLMVNNLLETKEKKNNLIFGILLKIERNKSSFLKIHHFWLYQTKTASNFEIIYGVENSIEFKMMEVSLIATSKSILY